VSTPDEADRVRIGPVERLSDNRYPLDKVRFTYRRRDGSTQELVREVYRNGLGAAVLPFDPTRGTVLLVRQFRLPALLAGQDGWVIEALAGTVEQDQSPEETARAEAQQEAGTRLRDLREVFAVFASPGVCAERMHLFSAEYGPEDRCGRGGGLREEGEEIEVLELPLAEAWAMVGRREIVDAKTVLLLQHRMLTAGGAVSA
jgi:nudix-type nucleoside diphosphatase (YffH/AdpP family)